MSRELSHQPDEPKPTLFPDTRWSLVLDAKLASDGDSLRALGELCQAYWFPLYTCARRANLSPQDAEDCVQGFLARLVEKRSFDLVAQEKGRLRAFLRVSIKNFITEQWQKQQRQKRGGGVLHISIDQDWAERQLAESSVSEADADTVFDRNWAQTLIRDVFAKLEIFYAGSGRTELYEAIK